ncbi:Gfo/Idh/MocA family oxidoreductase [Steroidobacter cummioxidans]|uniref:Gfo/Idh/MocA family oxidoreductase n=1 Tax=Steroidobacter cummioxidans TaxID=1803913 RepID=UPI000E314EA0|nr:Gfo/Idh/MocA family oxidoreductase [Steroidobacter cummioxidans]
MTLRAGIIGFGVAGRYFHAPLLRAAGFSIPAVVTSKPAPAQEYLGDVDVLATAEELLARKDIDMVVIASPSPLHVAHAAAALRAGKHVVVDKPLAPTTAEVSELEHLATQSQRKLSVFQNRRWDSDFLTIRKLIEQGRLGKINSFHARWDRFRPQVSDRWRDRDEPGNGILYDLGTHLIDQTLLLFGQPEWLYANVFSQRENSVTADGFEILLGLGSLRITIGTCLLCADGGYRYRVNGSQASFLKAGLDQQEAQLRAGVEPDEHLFGTEPAEQWGTLVQGETGQREIITPETGRWVSFYEAMREAIEQDKPVPVSAAQAYDTIRIVEAALTSSAMGCRIDLQPAAPLVSR